MLETALPKYIQLKNELQELIETGKLPANSLLPPENEMVSRFQVSRVTVRAALKELEAQGYISRERGRGTFVKELPKQQEPDSQTKEISLLSTTNLDNPFTTPFFTEFSKHLAKHNHEAVFRSIGNKPLIERLESIGLDHLRHNGLVLMDDICEDVADFIQLNKIPFTALGHVYNNLLSSVEGTQAEPIHWAVDHLVNHHKKNQIALIDGCPGYSYTDERYQAFKAATKKAGIWAPNLVVQKVENTPDSSYTTVNKWLEREFDFDAAICYSSSMTAALLQGIEKRGLNVPNDISLMVIEDLWLEPQLPYKLTKIQPAINNMAAAIAEIIVQQLDGGLITWNRKIDARIIMGESCGCQ